MHRVWRANVRRGAAGCREPALAPSCGDEFCARAAELVRSYVNVSRTGVRRRPSRGPWPTAGAAQPCATPPGSRTGVVFGGLRAAPPGAGSASRARLGGARGECDRASVCNEHLSCSRGQRGLVLRPILSTASIIGASRGDGDLDEGGLGVRSAAAGLGWGARGVERRGHNAGEGRDGGGWARARARGRPGTRGAV